MDALSVEQDINADAGYLSDLKCDDSSFSIHSFESSKIWQKLQYILKYIKVSCLLSELSQSSIVKRDCKTLVVSYDDLIEIVFDIFSPSSLNKNGLFILHSPLIDSPYQSNEKFNENFQVHNGIQDETFNLVKLGLISLVVLTIDNKQWAEDEDYRRSVKRLSKLCKTKRTAFILDTSAADLVTGLAITSITEALVTIFSDPKHKDLALILISDCIDNKRLSRIKTDPSKSIQVFSGAEDLLKSSPLWSSELKYYCEEIENSPEFAMRSFKKFCISPNNNILKNFATVFFRKRLESPETKAMSHENYLIYFLRYLTYSLNQNKNFDIRAHLTPNLPKNKAWNKIAVIDSSQNIVSFKTNGFFGGLTSFVLRTQYLIDIDHQNYLISTNSPDFFELSLIYNLLSRLSIKDMFDALFQGTLPHQNFNKTHLARYSQLYRKRILITGASSGIGKLLAMELSKLGCRLILVARRKELLSIDLGSCESENILRIRADITSEKDRDLIVSKIFEHCGGLDILVNNAGLSLRKGALTMANYSTDDIARVSDVNYLAPASLSLKLLPTFIAQGGGQIINSQSIVTTFPAPFFSAYSASKSALKQFMAVLAVETRGVGLQITDVLIPLVDTPMATATKTYRPEQLVSTAFVVRKIIEAMIKKPRYMRFSFFQKIQELFFKLFLSLTEKTISNKYTRDIYRNK